MQLSIVIITHNRLNLLKDCLNSLKRELDDCELVIILNGDDDLTQSWLDGHGYNYIKIEKTTPAQARNIALKAIDSKWVGFLDDDVLLPDGYGIILRELLEADQWDVVGGPDQTHPDASFWERTIGQALISPMASAQTVYRHKKSRNHLNYASEHDFILCNLWVRSKLLQNIQFNPSYFRNEENVLLFNLMKQQVRMKWSSSLYVFHKRKANLKDFYFAVSTSGENRMKSLEESNSNLDLRFLLPMLFLIYLFLSPLGLVLSTYFLIPMALYFVLNLITSLMVGGSNFLSVLLVQFAIVIFYGAGSWRYFLKK